MFEVESGRPVCLPYRKEEVRNLLLNKAYERSIIKYPEVYKIFEEDKKLDISQLTWRGCVWQTVEEVCLEIATWEGAIYYSMLSNSSNVPEDVFGFSFVTRRGKEYKRDTGCELSIYDSFTLGQKLSMANYERDRVYRHAKKYYKNLGNKWKLTMY